MLRQEGNCLRLTCSFSGQEILNIFEKLFSMARDYHLLAPEIDVFKQGSPNGLSMVLIDGIHWIIED
jgi:hypothetical protein